LICSFGVVAFMFADFMPTVRFSRLLFVLLTVCMAGTLILLPALLAGPAGRFFETRRAKPQVKPPHSKFREKSRKREESAVASY
jgi:hypothetical protein